MIKKAEKILIGKSIFTGLDDVPFEGAVAVNGNKISEVIRGTDYSDYVGDDTDVYDCEDKLIMPGFMDAHVHFFMGATASSPHMCMELDKSRSEKECIDMMLKFAEEHPDEERFLGLGWFPANWNDAPLPTKDSLDKAFPDKPVYLLCSDVHTIWTNSKGLAECGITKDTEVAFGDIPLGEDGEPNGLLIELEAMGPALSMLFNFPKDVLREIYLDFIRQISENGITSVGDMTASNLNNETITLYNNLKALEDNDELNVRIHLYSTLMTNENLHKEKELREKFDSEMVQYRGLKTFVDGVTSTYTGYLLEPYSDKPDTVGFSCYPKERYLEQTIRANKEGFGVRMHCIGDAAVRLALDVFEEANKACDNTGNKKGLKNTIEHIESMDPEDISRFKELGVIVSPQPYHLTLDADEKISRIGMERCRYEWPHRSMIDAGATLALGTDYPVVNFNPFKNIYSAISRCDDNGEPTGVNPEEKMTLAETLKGYTIGSAMAYGREDDLGTLEQGKLADIIVINKNLFDIPEFDINECEVDITIFNGNEIFNRDKK